MEKGQGQAVVTLECAHSFNSSCIGNSGVTYDNYLCPICPPEFNDILPSTVPNSNTIINGGSSPNPVSQVSESQVPVHSRVMYEPEPM